MVPTSPTVILTVTVNGKLPGSLSWQQSIKKYLHGGQVTSAKQPAASHGDCDFKVTVGATVMVRVTETTGAKVKVMVMVTVSTISHQVTVAYILLSSPFPATLIA